MWVLLMVSLVLPGMSAKLKTFDSYAACHVERNRIGFLMAESYPQEHDFNIICQRRKMRVV